MSFSVLCKRLEVMLVRDSGGTFGMTLRGGASCDPGKCRPLTVTQIRLGGPADRSTTTTHRCLSLSLSLSVCVSLHTHLGILHI